MVLYWEAESSVFQSSQDYIMRSCLKRRTQVKSKIKKRGGGGARADSRLWGLLILWSTGILSVVSETVQSA